MHLDEELRIIHEPARLRIMGMLYTQRDASFAHVRDSLGLSDGNLATHAKRLEQSGFLEARRVLQRGGFELRYRITPEGSAAFQRYLAALRDFLEATRPAALT